MSWKTSDVTQQHSVNRNGCAAPTCTKTIMPSATMVACASPVSAKMPNLPR